MRHLYHIVIHNIAWRLNRRKLWTRKPLVLLDKSPLRGYNNNRQGGVSGEKINQFHRVKLRSLYLGSVSCGCVLPSVRGPLPAVGGFPRRFAVVPVLLGLPSVVFVRPLRAPLLPSGRPGSSGRARPGFGA